MEKSNVACGPSRKGKNTNGPSRKLVAWEVERVKDSGQNVVMIEAGGQMHVMIAGICGRY